MALDRSLSYFRNLPMRCNVAMRFQHVCLTGFHIEYMILSLRMSNTVWNLLEFSCQADPGIWEVILYQKTAAICIQKHRLTCGALIECIKTISEYVRHHYTSMTQSDRFCQGQCIIAHVVPWMFGWVGTESLRLTDGGSTRLQGKSALGSKTTQLREFFYVNDFVLYVFKRASGEGLQGALSKCHQLFAKLFLQ